MFSTALWVISKNSIPIFLININVFYVSYVTCKPILAEVIYVLYVYMPMSL